MSDSRPPGVPGAAPGQPTLRPPTTHTIQPSLRPPPQQPGMGQQPGLRPAAGAGVAVRPAPPPAVPAAKPAQPVDDDSLSLVEDVAELVEDAPASSAPTPSKIKFGPDVGHKKHEWKRKPHVTGAGACRVRSFHAKYSEQGVEHMDDMINEWLDDHPEIEVKFVTQTVHVFEGKIREPALVMNVWY